MNKSPLNILIAHLCALKDIILNWGMKYKIEMKISGYTKETKAYRGW